VSEEGGNGQLKIKHLPTKDELDALLMLDLKTGELRWRERGDEFFKASRYCRAWNSRFSGEIAGGIDPQGYIRLAIFRSFYMAHRIVLKMVTGDDFGAMFVDHIDGNRANNRPSNLRVASNAENCRNRGSNRNSKTGVKGVTRRFGGFIATIGVDGRIKHLGLFKTIDDARGAYAEAAEIYHGKFARTS
jgi:hypothetical protein